MRTRAIVLSLSTLVGLLALPAAANDAYGWTSVGPASTCIGGSRCGGYGDGFEIHLDGRPVEAIRFFAHDNVGRHSDGQLRVDLDGYVLADCIDVVRHGASYQLDAHGARADHLRFATVTYDEVVVEGVEVLYRDRGSRTGPRGGGIDRGGYDRGVDDRGGYDRGGYDRGGSDRDREWQALPTAGCIGGDRCKRNGWTLDAQLGGERINGVRFYAHDSVGRWANGRLRVLLDGRVIEPGLEIASDGGWYEIQVRGVPAYSLTFEAITDDEVVIEAVEIRSGFGR